MNEHPPPSQCQSLAEHGAHTHSPVSPLNQFEELLVSILFFNEVLWQMESTRKQKLQWDTESKDLKFNHCNKKAGAVLKKITRSHREGDGLVSERPSGLVAYSELNPLRA